MLDLSERVAVVTGGTRGIGLATAKMLAHAGSAVVVAARRELDVERVAEELGPRALGVACDVRRVDECERLMARTVERFGRLDILINNAGLGVFAPVEAMSLDDWHRQIETNLDGVFYCCRAALPHLKRAGAGSSTSAASRGRTPLLGGPPTTPASSVCSVFPRP